MNLNTNLWNKFKLSGRVFFEKSSSAGYEVKHIITSDSQTTGSLELTGNISSSFISTGSVGRLETAGASEIGGALTVDGTLSIEGFGNISASLASAVAGGDNLGNHTATQDINRPGAEFSSERESEVNSLFGLGPIPAEIT